MIKICWVYDSEGEELRRGMKKKGENLKLPFSMKLGGLNLGV